MSSSTEGLSRLVARFTADRDELLNSMQQCQERVTDLVARLSSIERPADHQPADTQAEAAEIRAAVDRLRADMAHLEVERSTRSEDTAAWEAALTAVRDTFDGRLAALEADVGAARERLARLGELETRMEVVMDQWIQAGPSIGGTRERDPETALLHDRIEMLTVSLTKLSDGMEDLGAMRASLAGMHRRIDELGTRSSEGEAPDGVFDALERLRADLESLRSEVAHSARPDTGAGVREGLTEVRQAVGSLRNQVRSLDAAITAGLRSTTARWDDEARALAGKIDDVSRLFAAHAEAHRRSFQARAAEWARIAATMVATEVQDLTQRLPTLPRVPRMPSMPRMPRLPQAGRVIDALRPAALFARVF